MKNNLGLDNKKTTEIIKQLSILLANYQILYTNTRGFHWNIKGDNFFELHLKFEGIYNDTQVKIDEVAERILTLGGTPQNSFSEYLKVAQIKEISAETDGKKGLQHIAESLSAIISLERTILKLTDEASDEGTNTLVSNYITAHEKESWMYNAYLKN
jgi:starvation-inducible DNA-binding protein